MVDHIEAVLAGRVVGTANVDEADEAALRVVAQEGRNPNDILAARDNRQLTERDGPILDRLAEGRGDMVAQGLELSTHTMTFAQRSMVPVRRIIDRLLYKRARIQGWVGQSHDSYLRAIDLIASGKYPVHKLRTHVFGFDQLDTAVDVLAGDVPGEKAVNVVLAPPAP